MVLASSPSLLSLIRSCPRVPVRKERQQCSLLGLRDVGCCGMTLAHQAGCSRSPLEVPAKAGLMESPAGASVAP